MKFSLRVRSAWVAAIALVGGTIVITPDVMADGGVVRFRTGDGRLITTLFTPAEVLQDAAAEFAVLIQDEATGNAVLEAEVEILFVPPPGARLPTVDPWCRPPRSTLLAAPDGSLTGLPAVPLTRAQSDNKLLHAASLVFPVSGEWRGFITIGRGEQALSREFGFSVGMPTNRLLSVWIWLAMPPLLIGMFALNQRLRARR